MFPIPQKPGDKQCYNCGAVVHPKWSTVLFDGESGWVGNSECPECGNTQIHVSGSPSFVLPVQESLKEGGFITD